MRHRPDDIVISTPSKCGTTWLQMLVALLVFRTPDLPQPLGDISPWYDNLFTTFEVVDNRLASQTHRRFIKTHIPLDGLPLDDDVTYLVIGRDPRDAWVSMEHHGQNMNETARRLLTENVGPDFMEQVELPHLPEDPAERFRAQMELDAGTDHTAAHLAFIVHHLKTAWDMRDRSNIGLFHYADLQADLVGQMVRLAKVLDIEANIDELEQLSAHASLDSMRATAEHRAPEASQAIWIDPSAFFRRGGSGDWRSLATGEDLERYRTRVFELAEGDDDFLKWLHVGSLGSGSW